MPVIDLAFEIRGTKLPLDHGYPLFSALCRAVPSLHADPRVGVHPIGGRRSSPGVLTLGERSRLRLRLPTEGLAPYVGLAGTTIEVGGHRLDVGVPRVEAIEPAASLASRLVVFRGPLEPAGFEASVRRQLAARGVGGEPRFVPSAQAAWVGQPKRRVLKIKDKRVVGYALRLTGLTAAESLDVQERGLGGRRRFGCGVFVPFSPHTIQ